MISVARTLYDIAQSFDWPLDPEPRLRRALRLLGRIVPYDRCGLLDAPAAGPRRLVVEPDAAEERDGVSRILTRFLTLLTDDSHRTTDLRPPGAALVPLWASPSHLAVPLVGLDRVLGVLFVRGTDVYTDEHLRLMSVVAAQIAGYLTACRLREQEAQMVVEHEAARAAADTRSRAKDEFLAVLARELRRLLAPVQPGMERQVGCALRLLDDLLDSSRLGRDKVALHRQALTLQTIVAGAVERTRGAAEARAQRVSVSLPKEPLWLDADAVRLERVVVSLLDNAVKFTPPGGDIWVTGVRDKREIVLRVRDTGAGLAPELLPVVFDLCARADRSLPYAEHGVGVGLTLARILVELHGGTISAHSEGPGRGSELEVRLPAA